MKTNILMLLFFFSTLLFLGCDKKSTQLQDGIYKGTFTVIYKSGSEKWETTLELKNGKFSCTSGGSGTYTFDENKIIFNDDNYWTADFDWNLILNGEYDYTFDGKRLKISAEKNDVGHYKYDLKK